MSPVSKKGKKEDPGNHQSVILTSVPGKKTERLILETISVHREDKKVESGGFMMGKSCLTILIAFYDEITAWKGEERAVDFVYLHFSKALDTVSHNTLIGKLRKWGLDE